MDSTKIDHPEIQLIKACIKVKYLVKALQISGELMSCGLEALKKAPQVETYYDHFEVLGMVGDLPITITRDNVQTYAPQLTALHLANKNLTTIPPIVFQLTSLKRLDLSGNSISSVPEGMTRLENLEVLDLSKNHLTHFPPIPRQLQKLFLAENRIESIPDLSETALSILDLESNGVQFSIQWRFPLGIVRAQLSHNLIASLPDLSPYSQLRILELRGNPLDEECLKGLTIEKIEI